jgi:hypothetical protein
MKKTRRALLSVLVLGFCMALLLVAASVNSEACNSIHRCHGCDYNVLEYGCRYTPPTECRACPRESFSCYFERARCVCFPWNTSLYEECFQGGCSC